MPFIYSRVSDIFGAGLPLDSRYRLYQAKWRVTLAARRAVVKTEIRSLANIWADSGLIVRVIPTIATGFP